MLGLLSDSRQDQKFTFKERLPAAEARRLGVVEAFRITSATNLLF